MSDYTKFIPTVNTTMRKWEYYNMWDKFKDLYHRSKQNEDFHNIYQEIIKDDNIMLAYRSIKTNHGSHTPSTNKETIDKYASMDKDKFCESIRKALDNFQPEEVKRIEILKENGIDKRPLGIPSIRDRIIQQAFKQILEPIAEAKFSPYNFGFRPLRQCSHAIARCNFLINQQHMKYTVDVDIKGFFDNVNHARLLKQLWNIGIKDKRVLAIIMKMLKAPINKIGTPTKGVPQGGILSPLLANIVLNDLDHWVSSQWMDIPTRHEYSRDDNKYRAIKDTTLKEGYIVRYANDFKIFTNSHYNAERWYNAIVNYLKNRLKLEVSKEKSKITNIRKHKSEFLGISIKAELKGNKFIAQSYVSAKAEKRIYQNIRLKLKKIKEEPTKENIINYNSYLMGVQQYYKIATQVYDTFSRIAYRVSKYKYHVFSGRLQLKEEVPKNPRKYFIDKYEGKMVKTYTIHGENIIFIAYGVKWELSKCFMQKLTPYSSDLSVIKIIHKQITDERIKEELEKLKDSYMQQVKNYIKSFNKSLIKI